MGILTRHIRILAQEVAKDPTLVQGHAIMLGQQAVYATLEQTKTLLKKAGVAGRELPAGFDAGNRIPQWRNTAYGSFTNAAALLTLLGARDVSVVDVSPYESPDLLHDFNDPLPEKYWNAFDVKTAFSNLIRMTRVGGTILLALPASNAIDHGFYSFSPTTYFDFFCQNGCSVDALYLIEGSVYNYRAPAKVYRYSGTQSECPLVSGKGLEVLAVVRKREERALITSPIQHVYASKPGWSATTPQAPVEAQPHVQRRSVLEAIKFMTARYRPDMLHKLVRKLRGVDSNVTYLGTY